VPNVAKMHAFGHVGYAYIPFNARVKGDKFKPRAYKGHLVGMVGENIYLMWILETNKIITTASVKFNSYSASPSSPQITPPTPPESPKLAPIAPIAPIFRHMAAPAQAPQEARGDDDSDDEDNFQLPRAGGGDDFDGLHNDNALPEAPPTRGNNQTPRRREINADFDEVHIIHGPRLQRLQPFFTLATFDKCFAMALIKPTVGSKLSDLPPEPRN
jgi:hypothetical protein